MSKKSARQPDLEIEKFRAIWREIHQAYALYWQAAQRYLSDGTYLPEPEQFKPLVVAKKQYVAALHRLDDQGRDPFQGRFQSLSAKYAIDYAVEYAIDELRNRVGIIRVKEKRDELGNLVDDVADKVTVFEEIPIGIVSYYEVEEVALSQWSDEDLRLFWTERTGEEPNAENIAWLRQQSLPRRKDKPSKRGHSISRRLWQKLEWPFLDFDRLIVTPMNLVRCYHALDLPEHELDQLSVADRERLEIERKRLEAAIGGWMLSLVKKSHYMGQNKNARLSDFLPSHLSEFLKKLRPPDLIVRDVSSQWEMMGLSTQVEPQGAAQAALWCRRFKEQTLNQMSKTEGFRRKGAGTGMNIEEIAADTTAAEVSSTEQLAELILETEGVEGVYEEVMAQFTPQEREILRLRLQGKKYREIAESLNINIGTVKTFIFRANQRRQKKLPQRVTRPCQRRNHPAQGRCQSDDTSQMMQPRPKK